jgi:Uma2 family endonuclease
MTIAARRRLTYGDLVRMADDGRRHEIIEGEEFMTPPATADHSSLVAQIAHLLSAWILPRKLGRVFVEVGVYFGRHTFVEPDVAFLSVKRKAFLRKPYIHGPPDLAVEVLSPSTEAVDRGRKLVLYRDRGVREYWLVDGAERTIDVYDFGPPRRRGVYHGAQAFTSQAVKGLRLRVDGVFSVLE